MILICLEIYFLSANIFICSTRVPLTRTIGASVCSSVEFYSLPYQILDFLIRNIRVGLLDVCSHCCCDGLTFFAGYSNELPPSVYTGINSEFLATLIYTTVQHSNCNENNSFFVSTIFRIYLGGGDWRLHTFFAPNNCRDNIYRKM